MSESSDDDLKFNSDDGMYDVELEQRVKRTSQLDDEVDVKDYDDFPDLDDR